MAGRMGDLRTASDIAAGVRAGSLKAADVLEEHLAAIVASADR